MASPVCQITAAKLEVRYEPATERVTMRWYHPEDDLLWIESSVGDFLKLAVAVAELRIRIEQMAPCDG